MYRGYDNIRTLKEFYEELGLLCSKVEDSGFSVSTVGEVVVQLYNFKYSVFKDILWPILSALTIMHAHKLRTSRECGNISQQLLKNSNKPFNKAIELIMQKEEEEFHDSAKDYTKYQRKFIKTVIVDEYSQEGVQKNKDNDEQEFKEFFGKATITDHNEDTVLDELYILVRRRTGKYQLKIFKDMFSTCATFDQLVVGLQLMYPTSTAPRTVINIYEEWDMDIVMELTAPIPKILAKIKSLLLKYNIDSIRSLGTLCNKIQEHKIHD